MYLNTELYALTFFIWLTVQFLLVFLVIHIVILPTSFLLYYLPSPFSKKTTPISPYQINYIFLLSFSFLLSSVLPTFQFSIFTYPHHTTCIQLFLIYCSQTSLSCQWWSCLTFMGSVLLQDMYSHLKIWNQEPPVKESIQCLSF